MCCDGVSRGFLGFRSHAPVFVSLLQRAASSRRRMRHAYIRAVLFEEIWSAKQCKDLVSTCKARGAAKLLLPLFYQFLLTHHCCANPCLSPSEVWNALDHEFIQELLSLLRFQDEGMDCRRILLRISS